MLIRAKQTVGADWTKYVPLQVDADTVVYRESMKHLVNCMQHDRLVMGVCGETRVANKRQSWVTAIQGEFQITSRLL
jgi:cellulose synthase/poly-beta-1,6-N-acetylglucosamine synthase-like glycosyltransferase